MKLGERLLRCVLAQSLARSSHSNCWHEIKQGMNFEMHCCAVGGPKSMVQGSQRPAALFCLILIRGVLTVVHHRFKATLVNGVLCLGVEGVAEQDGHRAGVGAVSAFKPRRAGASGKNGVPRKCGPETGQEGSQDVL
jgi:hypothetical protein